MYNVSTKLFAILLTAASVAGLASCGNSKSEEQIKAEALLSDAQSMFDSRQYDKAIAIIDSLSKTRKENHSRQHIQRQHHSGQQTSRRLSVKRIQIHKDKGHGGRILCEIDSAGK